MTLDLRDCTDKAGLYQELRQKMGWEDWYGENLDALWDILTGLPHKGRDFTILCARDYGDAELTEYVGRLCAVFRDAQAEGALTVRVEHVGRGPV